MPETEPYIWPEYILDKSDAEFHRIYLSDKAFLLRVALHKYPNNATHGILLAAIDILLAIKEADHGAYDYDPEVLFKS
jgi:hypothetical protein